MSAANDRRADGEHIGELAELYALGALEPPERAPIEAHAAGCAACSRALGAAEATVTALDEAFVPQLEAPQRLGARIAASARAARTFAPRRSRAWPATPAPSASATAAALLIALGAAGGVLFERSAEERQATRDGAILATIANSHFNHVGFVPREASAPVSKVLYARDGAWFYVVVDRAACDCRVVARSATDARDLGKPETHGGAATLFVRDFRRPAALELVDASGRVISEAALAYPER